MLPIMAIGGISKAVDAISTGASWLSKQIASSSSTGDSSSSTASTGTDNPTSFASLLAAQGVKDPVSIASAATQSTSAIPTMPTVSASGHGHAAASSRVGHLG